jgi:hypothetical protein
MEQFSLDANGLQEPGGTAKPDGKLFLSCETDHIAIPLQGLSGCADY